MVNRKSHEITHVFILLKKKGGKNEWNVPYAKWK